MQVKCGGALIKAVLLCFEFASQEWQHFVSLQQVNLPTWVLHPCWRLSSMSMSLTVGNPELDPVLQIWPHQCQVGGNLVHTDTYCICYYILG